MNLTPHAYLEVTGLGEGIVYDLSKEEDRAALLDEVVNGGHFDDIDPNHADDGEPWIVIKVRPMPEGYAATLPEFTGW